MCYITNFLILLSLPFHLEAMCLNGPTFEDRGEVFCAYDAGYDLVFIKPGEYFDDDVGCMNCTCGFEFGLQCCGYGIMAGYMGVSDQCQVVMLDNCNYRIAKADNKDKDC